MRFSQTEGEGVTALMNIQLLTFSVARRRCAGGMTPSWITEWLNMEELGGGWEVEVTRSHTDTHKDTHPRTLQLMRIVIDDCYCQFFATAALRVLKLDLGQAASTFSLNLLGSFAPPSAVYSVTKMVRLFSSLSFRCFPWNADAHQRHQRSLQRGVIDGETMKAKRASERARERESTQMLSLWNYLQTLFIKLMTVFA